MNHIRIIPKPDSVSWADLTSLLHSAFEEHRLCGLNYSACDQPEEVTRERSQRGICLVALIDDILVGTATLSFENSEGHLCQVGVLPEYKGYGIGKRLVNEVIALCRQQKVEALYCNTSAKAVSVVKWYMSHNWQKIGLKSFSGTNYYSIEFRYPITGRRYHSWECSIRYYISLIYCMSLWREDGNLRPVGRFLKKIKYCFSH